MKSALRAIEAGSSGCVVTGPPDHPTGPWTNIFGFTFTPVLVYRAPGQTGRTGRNVEPVEPVEMYGARSDRSNRSKYSTGPWTGHTNIELQLGWQSKTSSRKTRPALAKQDMPAVAPIATWTINDALMRYGYRRSGHLPRHDGLARWLEFTATQLLPNVA